MQIEVSNGEIVDKLCIIEIKLQQIHDAEKRKNLLLEYAVIEEAVAKIISKEHTLYLQLLSVNQQLWDIEDKCRELEAKQKFDEEFIATARSVYITNDKRAAIKKEINLLTNSLLVEEKSYQ
ncbi:MAG: hypothetical protein RLZZ118_2257 [Bacteroidota bacterium]|jgi:hypothetical protein|nr:DUF6165 family protein [Chitinophagaceae bacterium]